MREYTIRRDAEGADEDLAMMRKRALEFLHSDEPPPLDSHPATLRAVKALHPDLEDREQGLCNRVHIFYAAAVRELARAKERMREAEAALRLELGSARYGVTDVGEPVVTRSIFERRSINGAGLRRDHPDIAAAYTNTTTVDKLTPRKDNHEQDL
jgi:hypothetical protein